MSKYIFFASLFVVAHSSLLNFDGTPTQTNSEIIQNYYQDDRFQHHPKYKFYYNVHNTKTGDIKDQEESRDGNNVQGYYSLVEPDGSKRIVEYSANERSGFNAIVRREYSQNEQIQHQILQQQQAQTYQPQIKPSLESSLPHDSDLSDKQKLFAQDLHNINNVKFDQFAQKPFNSENQLGNSDLLKAQGSDSSSSFDQTYNNIKYTPAQVYGPPSTVELQKPIKTEDPQASQPSYSHSKVTIEQHLVPQPEPSHIVPALADKLQNPEFKIEHIKPEIPPSNNYNFAHSEINIEQFYKPQIEPQNIQQSYLPAQQSPTYDNYKGSPSTGCSQKLEEPKVEPSPEVEKTDPKLPQSSNKNENSFGEPSQGYVYDKPAIKFELPIKNFGSA